MTLLKFFSGLCLILFSIHTGFAQENQITISGTVIDSETGESVVGAALYVAALETGTTSNQYGYYSLTIATTDSVRMVVSHIAYNSQVLNFSSQENRVLDLSLIPATLGLEEVEVTATAESILQSTQMSGVTIPIQDIQNLPSILGEPDVLRILQLMPGVQSGVEGSTGLYVRGGGPDQNLYLLDGTPIYNPSHLFGFLGTFNSDAIKDVRLLKGGFPARYGGRLSSVIDLTMKEGNMKRFSGTGAIGLLASRMTLEGPIKRDKASFLISARRSYADLLIRPFIDRSEEDFGYHFYDLNAKANVILSPRDRIYLSGYAGADRLFSSFNYNSNGTNEEFDEAKLGWRNVASTLRWNHIFGPRVFSNVLVGYTNYALQVSNQYQYNSDGGQYGYQESFESGIRDLHARVDVEFIPNSYHSIRLGASGILHSFLTGAFEEIYRIGDAIEDSLASPNRRSYGRQAQVYVEDDWRLSSRLRLNVGVHASGFWIDGENYLSVEPRVSALLRVSSNTSVKASVVQMQQYIHLLSTTSGLSLPTDLWVPSTSRVQPQQSLQIAAGFVQLFSDGNYELSIEGYYKWMDHLIEYKEGADYFDAAFGNWEDRVTSGRGRAYGGELFFQKKVGKTTGWIGYTLSWSRRQFDEINLGNWFPYRYDRRHDASLVISHEFSPKVDFSASWVYGTGQSVTLPVGEVLSESSFSSRVAFPWTPDEYLSFYSIQSSRNGFQIPAYHRLDLGVRLHRRGSRFNRILSFGTYNTYNRRNTFGIFRGYNDEGVRVFKKLSILPIIPAVSYQLSF